MSKHVALFAAMLLAAATVTAGDVWKDKPYQQWDEKDLRKILSDSPWAKTVAVEKTWAGSKGGPGGANMPDASRPTSNRGPAGSQQTGEPQPEVPGGSGAGAALAQVPFRIVWQSSRTIRYALARNAELRGIAQSEIQKFLATQPMAYELVVSSPDMSQFGTGDESVIEQLKTKTYLAPKKSKEKIAPSRIEVRRVSDGSTITSIAFFFEKKSGSGEPVFTPDEKHIDFFCQVGKLTLKTSFDPPKMNDKEGADF